MGFNEREIYLERKINRYRLLGVIQSVGLLTRKGI